MDSICIICKEKIEKPDQPAKLTQKGAESVNKASVERKSHDVKAVIGSLAHEKCRKRHVDKRDIAKIQHLQKTQEKTDSVARTKRQRLSVEERHGVCIFCTQKVEVGEGDGSKVETHNFSKAILECCESRGDEWAFIVKGKSSG